MISMMLIAQPSLIIADEPTSALDVTVRQQVLSILDDLVVERNIGLIFISHDLSVIKAISDYVIVMKNGKIVEEGETDAIFDRPTAEYTKTLIKSAFSAEVAG